MLRITFMILTVLNLNIPAQNADGLDSTIKKYTLLALKNYPLNKAIEGRVGLAQENLNQAKLSWFNNVNLSYQYNPSYTSANGNSVPAFGLGLSVNLGNILSTPSRIDQAGYELTIAKADYENHVNFIKAEVIRRMANYVRSVELLKVRMQAVNDSESSMLLTKSRFEKGETNLAEYNQALRTYTDNLERKVVADGDVMYHKASMEELIGQSIN